MPKSKSVAGKTAIHQREASVEVTTTHLDQQSVKRKKIKIRPFVAPTANVSVKFGATVPTGDYANVRVDVMVSVPCYIEEIVPVFNETRDLVDSLIDGEVERLTGGKVAEEED